MTDTAIPTDSHMDYSSDQNHGKHGGPDGTIDPAFQRTLDTGSLTLQPYEPPRATSSGRGRGRRNQRFNKQLPELETLLDHRAPTTTDQYRKFFTIQSTTGENLSEIDTITANKQIMEALSGQPKRITEVKEGHLLIEVNNEQQSRAIARITSLSNVPVKVEPHNQLNKTKGTIRYNNKPNHTDELILKELRPYGATEIYQIKTKRNGVLQNTPIYIVSFERNTLPPAVSIGWTRCDVRLYVPRPRRCFKCHRFGHGANNCRAEQQLCYNCGKEQHGTCTERPYCINCTGQHAATSKQCPIYQLEQETIAYQTQNKTSYSEAKKICKARLIRPGETFASVAARRRSGPLNLRRGSNAGAAMSGGPVGETVSRNSRHPQPTTEPMQNDPNNRDTQTTNSSPLPSQDNSQNKKSPTRKEPAKCHKKPASPPSPSRNKRPKMQNYQESTNTKQTMNTPRKQPKIPMETSQALVNREPSLPGPSFLTHRHSTASTISDGILDAGLVDISQHQDISEDDLPSLEHPIPTPAPPPSPQPKQSNKLRPIPVVGEGASSKPSRSREIKKKSTPPRNIFEDY